VVLVGQWRYTLDAYSWELVEGGAHDGEDSLAAARRELREEAGFAAARWERLGGELAVSNSVTDERAELWLAAGPHPGAGGARADRGARGAPRAVRRGARAGRPGEITDVLTVVGLLTLDRRGARSARASRRVASRAARLRARPDPTAATQGSR
jgi:8-oxo-dGTP pyrophosphatase MutT (NUDIX family)